MYVYRGIRYGTEFAQEYETEDEAIAMAEYDADACNSCGQRVEAPDGQTVWIGVPGIFLCPCDCHRPMGVGDCIHCRVYG